MTFGWRQRAAAGTIFLVGILFAQATTSIAQDAGSELVADVSAETSGPEASIALGDVSAFPDSGVAVLEPATPYEESFSYASVDAENNRLVGLTRPAAVAHSAGAFVQAPPAEPSPAPSPVPEGETPTTPPEDSTRLALCASRGDCVTTEEPPDFVEATCVDDGCGVLEDPPELFVLTCNADVCDVEEDPLGPWSVCDINDTDEECPDPDEVIDLVWGVDNPLSDLECTASVSGPGLSSGGGLVNGQGTFDCGEFVSVITVEVCLHRADGGAWVLMGCRSKTKGQDTAGGVWGSVSKWIAEPCARQRTAKYRIRARGYAIDGGGPGEFDEDRDTAAGTATLYCPGTSVEKAAQDAAEYAETWLPTGE